MLFLHFVARDLLLYNFRNSLVMSLGFPGVSWSVCGATAFGEGEGQRCYFAVKLSFATKKMREEIYIRWGLHVRNGKGYVCDNNFKSTDCNK